MFCKYSTKGIPINIIMKGNLKKKMHSNWIIFTYEWNLWLDNPTAHCSQQSIETLVANRFVTITYNTFVGLIFFILRYVNTFITLPLPVLNLNVLSVSTLPSKTWKLTNKEKTKNYNFIYNRIQCFNVIIENHLTYISKSIIFPQPSCVLDLQRISQFNCLKQRKVSY